MWESAVVSAAVFFLAACAEDKEQKAQTEEFAKAAAEASAQIAQQDDARCQSYGRPGSAVRPWTLRAAFQARTRFRMR